MLKKIFFLILTIILFFGVFAIVAEGVLRLVRGVPDNPLALIVQNEKNVRFFV